MSSDKTTDNEGTLGPCPKCGDEFPWVRLFPYKHQVSGHHRVMLFNEATICKPLMNKEYDFYKSVPPNILRYVPNFKGVAKASAKTDENGHDILYALPILNNELKAEIPCQCNDQRPNSTFEESHCQWKYTPGKDEDKKEYLYNEHPWVQKTQQISFKKNMYKTEGSKLILLEQIGYGYSHPCIMDLKMGVQQYGDNATEIKIRDHKERCEKSTSSSLGVRLCGMQVYDPDSNTYCYTDKYTGRQFDKDGFKKCLCAFLNGGKRLDVVDPIAGLLKDLHKGINSLDTCRFFGSSLLLLYDGDVHAGSGIEIRMIDFANVSIYNKEHIGPDHGYMFGLTNLCRLLEDIKSEFGTSLHEKKG